MVLHDQKQSSDWYWSHIEGMYICMDKFSSIARKDIYLDPLLFPDIYDLHTIVEEPASNGPVAVVPSRPVEYICSDECLDK